MRSIKYYFKCIWIIKKNTALLRNNAKIGDSIYVTGNPGESAAGLLLLKKILTKNTDIKNYLIKRHLNPIPRVFEGIALGKNC